MRVSFGIVVFALLVAACSTSNGASTPDAGAPNEAGPGADAAAGMRGGPCSGGICDDPSLECILDPARGAETCESEFTCTGPAPASFANSGGVSVSTWAEAQRACAAGTAGAGSVLWSTPCGGFVFLGQESVDSSSLGVFDAATGALVAVLRVGEENACFEGTATIPVSCPSGNPVACPGADGGTLDAGDASD